MLATIVTAPRHGRALLARSTDMLAQRSSPGLIHAAVFGQGDAVILAGAFATDPAIGDVVGDARGLAVERIAEAATAGREKGEHVATPQHVARLGGKVLDRPA